MTKFAISIHDQLRFDRQWRAIAKDVCQDLIILIIGTESKGQVF